METSAYTKRQLDAYYDKKIGILTERGAMSDARKEGEAIGLKKGEAIGRAEGLTIGLEKGKMEIAANLLKKGMSIDDVINVTGLPKQQIEKLVS
jgi:predicted transposase/invertase (TIGR01784 family)